MNTKQVPVRKMTQVIVLLLLPLFAACGGGGGGAGGPPVVVVPPPVVDTGVFIDSPVQGLNYQSGSNPQGTTDANGMFSYTVGEILSFSVGGVQLGTLPDGAPVITPNDFGAAAENIARFLQTLDADGNHNNGIDLTAAVTVLAATPLDASTFTSDSATFETTITPILEIVLGPGATLIDAATALANLAAATDSTFDVAELAGLVYVIDLPSANDVGIVVFEPLADPADSGSSVEMFMLSDTLAEGGDGTTTVLDWSVNASGLLNITDPTDPGVISIEKVGGSIGIISILISQGSEQLVGTFISPANGTVMDLSGDSGRSFTAADAAGTSLLTFFPDGSLSRVENDVVSIEGWILDTSGSLVTTMGDNFQVGLSVLLNGSFATGGDFLTVAATNLSGNPDAPVLQLDEMTVGTLMPVVSPDPADAVAYDFSTSATATSSDPVLEAVFAGVPVSGSFRYANWVPAVDVLSGPTLPGAAAYFDAMLDLAGSVNGLNFADAMGIAIVGNDRFAPLGGTDFLSLGAGNLDSGFDTSGYTLVNVRWFWIETDTTPEDFLASDLLPATLPDLTARLALDFVLISDPNVRVSVFFSDLTVTLSP